MFHRWFEEAMVGEEIRRIEIRKEEIWGRRCRIIERKGLEYTGMEDFNELVKRPCIFCNPEKVSKFGEDFGTTMLENDGAFLFPNISPYARHSGVCAFRKHYIKIDEFTPSLIAKNLELGSRYIDKIGKMEEVRFASISWNYMMPAGASILHPHTQILVDRHPTVYMEKLLGRREEFERYIEMEVESERFIGRVGKVLLFTPFVPYGYNEVGGIVEEGLQIDEISKALAKILSYYSAIGRNSFNVSIYISLEDEFPVHFRCITRQNMGKYYRNDVAFLERLHEEVVLERSPEEVAEDMRNHLNC